jgi:hypothetical protein
LAAKFLRNFIGIDVFLPWNFAQMWGPSPFAIERNVGRRANFQNLSVKNDDYDGGYSDRGYSEDQ